MSQCFPKPYDCFSANVKVELDLSNYVTKNKLNGAGGVDKCNLAAKSKNLASLNAKVYNIDVDKLKTVPADLSKLSNVVNNEVVKKIVYDKLVSKVDAIDSSVFALKTKYDTDKSGLKKKINDTNKKNYDACGLVKKTDDNAKMTY